MGQIKTAARGRRGPYHCIVRTLQYKELTLDLHPDRG